MQEFIRKIAYTIWERDGRPEGKDLDHWFRAEAVVRCSLRGHGGIEDMFEADRAMPALPSADVRGVHGAAPRSCKLSQ
jgi:hypothetical protein